MVKTIIGTSATRIITAIIGFIVVVLNSRFLGASGLGTISLIVLAISIILIVNEIVSGGALVYLIPRYNTSLILFPAYLWTFVNILIFSILLKYIKLVPLEYTKHVLALALIFSLASMQSVILIGKKRIGMYNIINLVQSFSLLATLSIFFFYYKIATIKSYIISLYVSYCCMFLLSFAADIKYFTAFNFRELRTIVKQMFRLGFFAQIANISQIFNYRLSYYLIDMFLGRAALGRFTIGVQVSESTWLISRSISTIHYSDVSNTEDKEKSRNSTVLFVKFISVLSALLLTIIILLPGSLFEFVFGKDFSGIPWIIATLSIGIVALSANMMFSAFFSGIGKIHINTAGSLIGLAVTVCLAFFLIPRFGLVGAALTSTLSYFTTTVFSFIMFSKITKTRSSEFLIKKSDVSKFMVSVRGIFNK